ncbi:MAG: response regulator, partial [Flavobacteriales bacterium]|nr:response regulator [Flavobacteriales bacterium]
EFASMEFSSPELHHYQYKLDGFDPDWIMAGTANSAIYTNLDPGTYTFRVRGDNRDGVWDTEGTSFQLVVLPPWWKTWWAYVMYALVAAGSLLLYIRLRTAGLQKQKEILEVTVAERTEALIHEKEEADAQRRRAEHSERIKQQFLANMSHEIRTPMNAIMGMTSSLRRNERLPAQEKYLAAIAESSSNLLVILNDILDIGKLEAGKIELERVAMQPRDVLRQAMDILRHKAEEKGLRFECKVDEDVPVTVMGDPTRLGQIMLNLVGNAIKFTEKGEVRIAVHVKEQSADRVVLSFVTSDTGIGIRDDRKGSIFEEFTQADNETSRKYGGSGLGLTITKRLVELQHGTIVMESTHGAGSTFTVELPYGLPSKETSAKAEMKDAPAGVLHDLRILLAEDNEFNVMVAQDELADVIPGSHVDVAGNGRIAVEMVKAGNYDLVLMDIQMPEMNGFDAARAIRALAGNKSRIPIIAMTANVLKAEVDKCMEARMNGFVPKPFKREELVNVLHSVLSTQPSKG